VTGLLPADAAMLAAIEARSRNGVYRTTYRSLAHAAGVARSTSHACLRRLQAAGLVSVEPDPAGGLRIMPLGGSS
jgi:DNA-binding IclR family transcriptional regulator